MLPVWEGWIMGRTDWIERGFISAPVLSFLALIASITAVLMS
jgi:hypothetical protein